MNTAVFVSGNGTNLQALIDAASRRKLAGAKITLVVCDKPGAYALKRAAKAGIETYVQPGASYATREEYDRDVIAKLKEKKIKLVVLAGFMRILSDLFIKEYRGRILNVHPALLPSFKGAHGIKDAFDHGAKITGVTVHFVDEELDGGAVILQEPVEITGKDTLRTLEGKIHKVEHRLYPEAVRLFVRGKLKIKGRRVKISGR